MTACIVGWAHTRFGKHENEDIESLIVKVAAEAIRDAGLEPKDIDEVFIGTMNAGFVRQEFPSSLVLVRESRSSVSASGWLVEAGRVCVRLFTARLPNEMHATGIGRPRERFAADRRISCSNCPPGSG